MFFQAELLRAESSSTNQTHFLQPNTGLTVEQDQGRTNTVSCKKASNTPPYLISQGRLDLWNRTGTHVCISKMLDPNNFDEILYRRTVTVIPFRQLFRIPACAPVSEEEGQAAN